MCRLLLLLLFLPVFAVGQDLPTIARNPNASARLQQLNTLIQRQPSAAAHYYRALAHLELQDATRAQTDLAAAQRLNLQPPSLLLAPRSWVALLASNHTEGLRLAQQALAANPQDQLAATLQTRHQQALARRTSQTQAEALADSSRTPVIRDVNLVLAQASEQTLAGDYRLAAALISRAIPVLREQLKQRPSVLLRRQLYGAYLQRAEVHWAQQDLNRTLSDLTSAISTQPERPDAYERLGQLQVSRGNWPQAIRAYEQLYQRLPNHPTGWVNLGYAYSRQGEKPAALRTYNRALALPQVADRAQLLNNRGSILLGQNDLPAAARDLNAAVQADPNLAIAHISLGEYHLAKEDWPAAQQAFTTVLGLHTADSTDRYLALYRRAAAHAGALQVQAAEADLRAAIQMDPGYADAHEALALLLDAQDRQCEALRTLENAARRQRRLSPEDPQIPRLLARLQGLGLQCP